MTNRLQKSSAALGATGIVAAAIATGIFADPVRARQPSAAVEAPATPVAPATPAAVSAPAAGRPC